MNDRTKIKQIDDFYKIYQRTFVLIHKITAVDYADQIKSDNNINKILTIETHHGMHIWHRWQHYHVIHITPISVLISL
jgi:hypothetical protein